ncbi:hypothetical protein PO124_28860 [Bacillus licheniformis]|nr:hypothetical protein [Bacillus licheniformis]
MLGAKPRRRNQIRFLDMFGQREQVFVIGRNRIWLRRRPFRMTASLSHSANGNMFLPPEGELSALARLSLQAEEKLSSFTVR